MHDSPHIDVGNLHEYDYDYQQSNTIESPHFEPCLKAMYDLDKPLIIGETGIESGDGCRTSRERRVEEVVEVLERELQRAADEKGRLFETVVAAVAERDFGRFHFRDGPAIDVPDGLEVVQGIIEERRDFVHVVFREKDPKGPAIIREFEGEASRRKGARTTHGVACSF